MMKIVAPISQRHWKWPAVLNFFLGGSASGLFLHLFWNNLILNNPSVDRTTIYINLLPALIALAGFSMLSLEAGRPFRGIFLLHHLTRSWMSREALFGLFFISLSISYALTDLAILAYGAVCAAFLLMFSQGYILARARAVSAWNCDFIPIALFTSGICSGYGLWIILHVFPAGLTGNPWVTWGIFAILMNLAAWGIYLRILRTRLDNQSVIQLRAKTALWVALDGVIPLIALIGIYFSGMAAETAKAWFIRLGLCCGISLCLGAWLKLHHLLHKGGLMRPVTAKLSIYPPQILSKE